MAVAPFKNSACVSLYLLSDSDEIRSALLSQINDPMITRGGASFSDDLFPIAAIHKCDVVVAHVSDSNFQSTLRGLASLQRDMTGLKFVILDQCATPERAVAAMKAGANDYISLEVSNLNPLAAQIEQICLDGLFEIPQQPSKFTKAESGRNALTLHRKVQKVLRAAKFLASCRTLPEICEGLMETIGEALDATGGSLYLVNGNCLERVHSLDPGHAPDMIEFPLVKGSLFEQVYSSGEPLMISAQRDLPFELSSGWTGYEGDSVLVYPLIERSGDLIGLFSLHGKKNTRFTKEDRDLVLILASYSHETIRSLLAQERSRKAFESLELTFENMNEGILLINKDNVIVQHNQNAAKIIGLKDGELTAGMNVRVLYDTLVARGDRIDQLSGTSPWVDAAGDYEYHHFCVDGTIIKIHGNELDGGGYVLTLTDITEQKRWEKDLFEAKEKAEAASISKSNFLANISHELRTPLNAIIGFSEVMKKEIFGELPNQKYGEYVSHINDSGAHLLTLINNLLDLSKVEAGKFQLSMEQVDLGELVRKTATYFGNQAETAGIDLMVKEGVDVGSVWADENALHQICSNLISNAIKFTPQGGQVKIGVDKLSDSVFRIIVEDTGIGMEEKSLEVAMQPFGQVENAFNRRYPGTGLGLPLVASLSELHGGEFRVESTLGLGTTCFVALPVGN